MSRARLIILAFALLLGSRPCAAGSAGAEPFSFLFLDANARAAAMGGAYTAMARDANALLYNPAGLAGRSHHEATFMHNEHFEGIRQEYLGLALRNGWGANINYLTFGDVPRTTISNPTGAGLGSAGLTDLAFTIGHGRAVQPGLNLGAGFKFIRESIDSISAEGYALDLGLLYESREILGLRAGLALQNMGPAVTFQRAKESLPFNIRAGTAYETVYRDVPLALALDVMKERREGVLAAFGAETVVQDKLMIRLGFASRNDAGPGVTFGFGWLHERFMFDYALVPYGELGFAHRMSVTLRWGGDVEDQRLFR